MELLILFILILLYFLPSMVASSREHSSTGAIFVLNLFLGWTFLGWVVAFVWAFTNSTQVVVNNSTTNSVADEIQKLASLKEQGLLTEEEFNKKKSEILNNA